MKCLKTLTLWIWLLLPAVICAQQTDRFQNLEIQFTLMTLETPGLEEPVDLSVSNVPLQEFLRALGTSNEVNISVDPVVQGQVVNNFSNVSVAEVLIFLAKQYNLDFEITGNIIHVKPYVVELPPPIIIPRTIPMVFDPATKLISMELQKDSLARVAKALTMETKQNVVFEPGLENKLLSIYVENVPFDQAMDKLAFANNLQISKTQDNFYLIRDLPQQKDSDQKRFTDFNSKPNSGRFNIDSNLISLDVENQPLDLVIRNLFDQLGIDYFLYSRLDQNITSRVANMPLDQLLEKLFYGTKFTFRLSDSLYIIGDRALEGLRETRRIYLNHRSVEKVIDYIPADLKKDIEIKEFSELNSLIVSGSYPQILALEEFITSIDKSVPVVIIEVLIVDYQRTANVTTGLEAGTGENPNPGGQTVFPGVDYTLNANAINELIKSFDGFGSLNLGPVTPNFYVNLRLLEENGFLRVKSTPKLSTLNGHEATISMGNTEYYVVEQTNVTGVQNPIPITTRNYQQVQANFNLTIKPIVSGDDQVTLDISVEQTDFTARISPEAPPGQVSRKFTSLIRVGNEEMIILGGLEEKGFNDNGSGFPILSRIPVLKWFFSSRNHSSHKNKLNIFIKPTIIN